MLRYKTTNGVVNKINKSIEKGVPVCVELVLTDGYKNSELIALFAESGFSVIRRVTHIDNVSKEKATEMGYESLDFGTDEVDENGWRFSETLVQAECLKRGDDYIQIYIGNVCGHFCHISCGQADLLTKYLE